jgi:hypothetical protein
MGNLKPGVTYIYERVNDVIYAREEGKTERREVGRDYNLYAQMQEDKLWGEIRRAAKTNPTLQTELDRVIMVYQLTKEQNGQVKP